jgi:hypothetical protein
MADAEGLAMSYRMEGRDFSRLVGYEKGLLQKYVNVCPDVDSARRRFRKERLLMPDYLLEDESSVTEGWEGPSWRLPGSLFGLTDDTTSTQLPECYLTMARAATARQDAWSACDFFARAAFLDLGNPAVWWEYARTLATAGATPEAVLAEEVGSRLASLHGAGGS